MMRGKRLAKWLWNQIIVFMRVGVTYGEIVETMQINKEIVGRAVRHLRLAHTYRYQSQLAGKPGSCARQRHSIVPVILASPYATWAKSCKALKMYLFQR